jgi:broad specificity phosphatase PhoE
LWIIRHGQSAGNVARDAADLAGLERIALEHRDVDVPLSELGRTQADALGDWFARTSSDRPAIILTSPYLRARQTADAIGAHLEDVVVCTDERLREKEFGILDGLTTIGVRSHHPEQASFRATLGKFYHRPPGGESWVDVIFRLRSMLDTISLHHGGQNVLIVAHQVVVLCLRYIIEYMDEAEILEIDKAGDVANCSVTEYRFRPNGGDGRLELLHYNSVQALTQEGSDITAEPDPMVAARG